MFMGYLNMEDKTREAIDSTGWLHSGDIGKKDGKGFLYITGRIKGTDSTYTLPPLNVSCRASVGVHNIYNLYIHNMHTLMYICIMEHTYIFVYSLYVYTIVCYVLWAFDYSFTRTDDECVDALCIMIRALQKSSNETEFILLWVEPSQCNHRTVYVNLLK